MSVLVVGTREALALCGADPTDEAPRLVVALDDAPPPVDLDLPLLRWRSFPGDAAADELLIAPSGSGLWSCAPWPVRDELFALAAAAPGSVLIVEPDGERREKFTEMTENAGLRAAFAERLTVEGIAAADVIVHGAGQEAALPGDAMAVLAAGRLLITGPCTPNFGLRPGIDHLAAPAIPLASALADAVAQRHSAFRAMRALGRIAAERHRASEVYANLALELQAASGRDAIEPGS